jgi:hypothetical protein
MFPPTKRSPPMPTPPDTTNAPVLALTDPDGFATYTDDTP